MPSSFSDAALVGDAAILARRRWQQVLGGQDEYVDISACISACSSDRDRFVDGSITQSPISINQPISKQGTGGFQGKGGLRLFGDHLLDSPVGSREVPGGEMTTGGVVVLIMQVATVIIVLLMQSCLGSCQTTCVHVCYMLQSAFQGPLHQNCLGRGAGGGHFSKSTPFGFDKMFQISSKVALFGFDKISKVS